MTISRNYDEPRRIRRAFPTIAVWADSRATDLAIACAIYAISDDKRIPEQIWEDPTAAEVDHIKMAIAEYITCGDIEADDMGYVWGETQLKLDAVQDIAMNCILNSGDRIVIEETDPE
jgi:hypothetical protein